jgi:hypothetical protein
VDGRIVLYRTVSSISIDNIDLLSCKDFDDTVRDLVAELGKASTHEFMDRLTGATDWNDYAAQCAALAGRGKLIEVGHFNWGAVLALSGIAMKARCFIVGNGVTAQNLLAAGDPALSLYLPTKILVFETSAGNVHVAYDRLPFMTPSGNNALSTVAAQIDEGLETLAQVASR